VNPSTLVLNLGLKSMRAAVFDGAGIRAAIAYRPIESRMGEGRVEQDPNDWWRAALDTMDEVLADRVLAGRIRRITVTASAGCLVAMDAAGDVVRPAIMISDVRSREQAERIGRDAAFAALGIPGGRVTPDLLLPKIVWLREHEPAADERARWFGSPNDFLVQRLTGEVVTDAPNASKYLHDGATGYPAALLAALDIPLEALPPVVAGGDAVLPMRSGLRERYGLADEVRVVLSTYDAICAVYGSGVADLGDACDVSGTVTSFRAVTDRAERDPDGRLFTIPHVGTGRYLAGGSNNLGGGVIEWAKQTLYPDDPAPYDTMVAEATEAPPGAAGLTFLPYLLGERAPVWDPTARGVLFGLGRNHGRADLIRAIFEGVGYSVLDIADRLGGMGVPVRRVSASGGLARLPPIVQIKADMLGVPVVLTDELETSALGAALVAGVHIGDWPSIEAATEACVRPSTAFEPVAERTAMYRDFFGLYRELYERLAPTFRTREDLIARHSGVLRTVLARTENL
jgi:sugar (pentulose or hexulose) kinase